MFIGADNLVRLKQLYFIVHGIARSVLGLKYMQELTHLKLFENKHGCVCPLTCKLIAIQIRIFVSFF